VHAPLLPPETFLAQPGRIEVQMLEPMQPAPHPGPPEAAAALRDAARAAILAALGNESDRRARERLAMGERDIMNYDVAIVGAGPAGLACALRLRQLQPERSICVIEKRPASARIPFPGAVLDPVALDALLPEWRTAPPRPVCRERVTLHGHLTGRRSVHSGSSASSATGSSTAPEMECAPRLAAFSITQIERSGCSWRRRSAQARPAGPHRRSPRHSS